MLIGITGVIGSGKSIVTKTFQNLGFKTYDCDNIVLLAYQDLQVQDNLLKEFHTCDKEKIKLIINKDNITKLNQIIHPFVINYIKHLKEVSNNEIIFIETPLLYELDLTYLFDKVIVVYANENIRNQRLLNRNKDNYLKMKQLEKFQLAQEIKMSKADYLIDNNFDVANVIKQVQKLVDLLPKLT